MDLFLLYVCLKDKHNYYNILNVFRLSFKRVKGNINEFEINSYDDYHNLILSYCRIYTNVNSSDRYCRLFITLFDIIKQLTGKPV
ncbi:hypothetical protein RhiirB3_460242 [Rhizophagus irregularis]|nr:hypothetical protein RhiirB3_460242 [Rhizophagus irregularis]